MSYASLDEAFPSVSSIEGPKEKNRHKKNKKLFSRRAPEPLVIEPDRPGARPPQDVEILRGSPTENTESSSLSNYLVAAPDPSEDLFPYPLGSSSSDNNSFMLEPTVGGFGWEGSKLLGDSPDWTAQFALKKGLGVKRAETPIAPMTPVDGYSTLWENIPNVMTEDKTGRTGKKTNAIGVEDELRDKVDRILERLDSQDYKLQTTRDTFSEILLFVLLGISIILLIDLFFRSQQSALIHLLTSSVASSQKRGGGQYGGGSSSGRYSNRNTTALLLRRLRSAGFI